MTYDVSISLNWNTTTFCFPISDIHIGHHDLKHDDLRKAALEHINGHRSAEPLGHQGPVPIYIASSIDIHIIILKYLIYLNAELLNTFESLLII